MTLPQPYDDFRKPRIIPLSVVYEHCRCVNVYIDDIYISLKIHALLVLFCLLLLVNNLRLLRICFH